MLKITPIKQQTGARFWPGDLGQPRAAGEAARATQQLTRTFQQGLNTIGQLVADQDRVSKAAHRNYVSGAIKSDIQDSLRHALVTAKPDGSNLFEIYDKDIGGKNLIERYTKDADDDEKKYLSGVISGEVARLRGGLLQPFLQRGTQQAEITITNMVNDNANEIRDSWHLSTFFKKQVDGIG